jgi:hypothetical protein
MEIDPNVVIDRLGGTTAVAKICELKPPTVSEWRTLGIPRAWLKYFQIAFPEAFAPVQTETTDST